MLDFDDTTDESIDFVGVVPRSYNAGDLEVIVCWAATSATTGNVVWQAEFERHPIDDATFGTHDLDTDGFGTAQTTTAATASSAGQLVRSAISLAASDIDNAEPGESFRLRVSRVATDSSDTLVGDAELLTIEVREV